MHGFKARLTAGFIFLSALLPGCAFIAPQTYALKEQRPAGLPPRVELTEVPFYPQDDYYCGPSALAMAPFNAWPILFVTMPVLVWLIDGYLAGLDPQKLAKAANVVNNGYESPIRDIGF